MNIAAKIWGAFAANHNTRPDMEGQFPMASVTQLPAPGQPQAGTVHWLNECIERGKSARFSEEVLLTPGLAGELLRRNPDNRGVRKTKATQYTADIRAGKWVFNGEPIIISDTGELNDGQHRAAAVVDANMCIPVLMVFGLPRESRTTIDQGAARTASDYLSMQGMPNATIQASLARNLIAYERNDRTSITGVAFITNGDVMQRVHSDTDVAASAHFAAINARITRPFAAPAVIGFCHYVFSDIHPLDAATYMTQLCRGEGLRAKDPAYTVRERLVGFGSASREKRIHLIYRGWNAFRQGRKLELAKIVGDENIPAAI